MSKLSPEAFDLILKLLENEKDLQQGHEDRIEEINTVIEEVEGIGVF